MYSPSYRSLEALSQLGGAALEPFYSLLEGGREGGFFKELEEFFYYAQIRRYVCTTVCVVLLCACSQSVEATGRREVSCTVPVEQLPDIMRAVGYYPSEEEVSLCLVCVCVCVCVCPVCVLCVVCVVCVYCVCVLCVCALCVCVYCVCVPCVCVCTVLVWCVQIGNMLNEVKFSNYISSKVFKTQIDLGDTLKCKQSHPHTPHTTHPPTPHTTHTHTVYINHRPAFGLSPGQFLEAFKALGQRSGDEYTVDRTTLLELLQEKGVLVCVCVC